MGFMVFPSKAWPPVRCDARIELPLRNHPACQPPQVSCCRRTRQWDEGANRAKWEGSFNGRLLERVTPGAALRAAATSELQDGALHSARIRPDVPAAGC